MRRLTAINETWETAYLAAPLYELEELPQIISELHPVDAWWNSEMPTVNVELKPFIIEYMKQKKVSSNLDVGCLIQSALDQIGSEGTESAKQMASSATIMWNERHPRTAGKLRDEHVGWGERYPRIDYVSQELTIGDLHFVCIDMGFELPMGLHLRTALGEQDKL